MLTIVGVGLAIILPLFYFSLFYSSQATAQVLASDAVNSIAYSADYLYSLGNQSATTLRIRLPEGIANSAVGSKTILLKLNTTAGTTDVFAVTKANVTGSLPKKSGYYLIKLQNVNSAINISW